MNFVWPLLAGAARAGGRLGLAAGRAAAGGLQQAGARRGAIAAASGVLGPGDPPPPPDMGGFFDYRGLASPRDLRHAHAAPVPLGRVVDAHRGAAFPIGLKVRDLARHGVVVGTSGSGKTESVVVPWAVAALAAGHHVFITDVKGDLLQKIAAYRSPSGPVNADVAIWDFTAARRSQSWNWLVELDTPESFAAAAEALVGREKPGDPQPYFGQRDRRVLAAILRAVRTLQPRDPQSELVTAAARDQKVLQELARLVGGQVAGALTEVAAIDSWDFPRAMSGVVNAISFLDHPGVRAVTTRDQLRISQVLASPRPTLVVVSAPLSTGPVGLSASALMLSQLTTTLYRRFADAAQRPVTIVVDEAPRIRDRLNFEELTAVARGSGVSVVLALQSVDQLPDEAERHAVLGNCHTCVFLPSPSVHSAEYFQRRFGEHHVPVLGRSEEFATWTRPASRSVTRSVESRPVLGIRELLSPPWGGFPAFVHAPALSDRPIAVDLTRDDLA